jgi:hypothetical protein
MTAGWTPGPSLAAVKNVVSEISNVAGGSGSGAPDHAEMALVVLHEAEIID